MTGPRRKPALPVIRLGLVRPLTEELERRGVDYQSVLSEFSLEFDDVESGETFVPAPTMYAIVERLAGSWRRGTCRHGAGPDHGGAESAAGHRGPE